MTSRNLTKLLFPFKPFLSRSLKKKSYIASLERAYVHQALELERLKRIAISL